jgi:hypothetical protein
MISQSGASMGGTGGGKGVGEENAVVEQKHLFHPFAEKQSPFEEWKQALIISIETMIQFMLWDVCANVIIWSGKSLAYVFILTPILIAGLLVEYCRRCKNKVIFSFSFNLHS